MKNHQDVVNKNFLRTLRRKHPQEFGPNVRGGHCPCQIQRLLNDHLYTWMSKTFRTCDRCPRWWGPGRKVSIVPTRCHSTVD